MRKSIHFLIIALGVLWHNQAFAAYPKAWQLGFQEAATPVMDRVVHLHNILLIVIFSIAALVLSLMFFTLWRFSAKRHPIPTRTTHNIALETFWTLIPALIVLVIAFPSIRLLFYMDTVVESDMTVKIVGRQWYWHYAYPDKGQEFEFDSVMLTQNQLKDGQFRLLEVDNAVVVPVDTTIKFLVTSDDVIHSWAVPSFGVKHDCVPGRLRETWIRVSRPGTYYGQCSELCGSGHGYMPIAVKVVTKAEFKQWLVQAKKKFASLSHAHFAQLNANVTDFHKKG